MNDRILFAIKVIYNNADKIGIDNRTKHIFNKIIDANHISIHAERIAEDISKALKQDDKFEKKLTRIMLDIGFSKQIEGKHIKFKPNKNIKGVKPIIVPKTPSDHRSLKNLKSEILRELGISTLKKVDNITC
jgi:hypothetical protein